MVNEGHLDGGKSDFESSPGDLDGTTPITNRNSQMVMLRGERGDKLQVDEFVEYLFDGVRDDVPGKFTILRRMSTFYGTELLLEPFDTQKDSKYLLTAPGPDKNLVLWKSETDFDGYRIGWSKLSELKASFTENIPNYPICNTCGEPIKSLDHERLAAMEQCEKLSD